MIRPDRLVANGTPRHRLGGPIKRAYLVYAFSDVIFQSMKAARPEAKIPNTQATGRRFLEDILHFGGTDDDLETLIELGAMEEADWELWDDVIAQSVDEDFHRLPASDGAA